jgi:hypothetical protein
MMLLKQKVVNSLQNQVPFKIFTTLNPAKLFIVIYGVFTLVCSAVKSCGGFEHTHFTL